MLVSALTREAATGRVQIWLSQADPSALIISDWVITEFASALSMKLRMKQLTVEDRARAAGLFTRMKADSLIDAPVTRDHFVAAARFAGQHELGLRSGEALHVAIAADHGATIVTLDQRLAEAAISLGVSAEIL